MARVQLHVLTLAKGTVHAGTIGPVELRTPAVVCQPIIARRIVSTFVSIPNTLARK